MKNKSFFDKFKINFGILFMLLRKQFFLENKFLFIIIPIFISLIIVKNSTISGLFSDGNVSILVTIVSLIGGILLNFLILILQDTKSILYVSGNEEIYGELKGKFNDDFTRKIIVVNYFEFIYNKIFFIIFLSVIFIIIFIFKQLGIFNFIIDDIILGFNITCCKKWIIYFPYILFLTFYFTNVLYLLLKLSFLLQNKK